MKVKKTYYSPQFIVIDLDRSTSLSMLSEYTPPGDPLSTSGAGEAPPQQEQTKSNSFKENPFD